MVVSVVNVVRIVPNGNVKGGSRWLTLTIVSAAYRSTKRGPKRRKSSASNDATNAHAELRRLAR